MSGDDAKPQDSEKKRKRVEPRVIGHVTERTREARPDDPMFGCVLLAFLSDLPADVEVDDHQRSDPKRQGAEG